MVNIDKNKINENINEAYNNQTEKVKELLESAKKNLVDQKECPYDYTINKDKANELYKINRIITKKKKDEKDTEDKIEIKFNEMNEKLNINSKNIDFIFENVTNTNESQISILNKVLEKQNSNENVLNETNKQIESISNQQDKLKKVLLKNNENIVENISKKQSEIENVIIENLEVEGNILKKQSEIKETLLNSQNLIESKITELHEIEDNLNKSVQNAKTNSLKSISRNQNKIKQVLLQANLNLENNIIENQKEVQKETQNLVTNSQMILENKLKEIEEVNKQNLIQMKNEILATYQKENKHAINTLLEERNAYLLELQEKDKQIRALNYKIYEFEEKLENEIAKREKVSLFTLFFKKKEVQEEEPTYITQILNYV